MLDYIPVLPAPPLLTTEEVRTGYPTPDSTVETARPNARISVACEACKKRKTKCSGGPQPCELCEGLGTACVFDPSRDMRRKAAFLRASNASNSYLTALNYIVDCMREGPSRRLDALFAAVGRGTSSQEIADFIGQTLAGMGEGRDDDMVGFPGEIREPSMAQHRGMSMATEITRTSVWLSQEHNDDRWHELSCFRTNPKESTESQEHVDTPNSSSELQYGRTDYSGVNLTNAVSAWPKLSRADARHVRSDKRPQGKAIIFNRKSSSTKDAAAEWLGQTAKHRRSLLNASSGIPAKYQIESTLVSMPPLLMSSSSPFPYLEPMTNLYITLQTTELDLCVAQEGYLTRQRIPRHLILPLVVPHNAPLSRIYTDYWEGARRMLERGADPVSVLGPPNQTAVDLIFRPRGVNDGFKCASWASEVCRSGGTEIFVRLASAHLLTMMMRWLLVPTLENYEKVPDMMKPTPLQCMVPHIGAIDTIPLPPVRDAVIWRLRDWLGPLISARWSVNWVHGLEAAIVRDPSTGDTVLTEKFIQHATLYDNWSVDSGFLGAFPEVKGRIRLHGNK